MAMKRVLIVQNVFAHYRIPIYRKLAEHYELTIAHSGNRQSIDGILEVVLPRIDAIGLVWQTGLLRLLAHGGYDVVVAMFDVRWLANNLAVLMRRRHRLVYWGHRYGHRPIVNRVREWLMHRCDAVLLYNAHDIDQLVEAGIRREAIFVANNTVHVPNAGDFSGEDKCNILFVGRLEPRKKVETLILNFQRATGSGDFQLHLDVVGDGSERGRLEMLASSLGLSDRIRFYGDITDPERLKPLFARAYAYVSPGPVGLGLLHAFAYGVPVITIRNAYHGPESSNLVHGWNGLLYDEDDDLTEIVMWLQRDPGLFRTLGRHAYETYAQCCAMERMVDGFVAAIEGTTNYMKPNVAGLREIRLTPDDDQDQ